MQIQTLQNTPLQDIVTCMLDAFSEYFVKLPSDVSYWDARLKAARFDRSCSAGVFEDGKLVGYILHGVDRVGDKKIAFNTGTGVIKAYRGNALVDKMYDFMMPKLKRKGVTHCELEVITENHRAIRVYERVGMSIKRRLKCYAGELKQQEHPTLLEISLQELFDRYTPKTEYAWDFTAAALLFAPDLHTCHLVLGKNGHEAGYFSFNPSNSTINQIEAFSGDYDLILQGVAQLAIKVRIINVDETRTDLIAALERAGFENTLDQYEMEMCI